MADVRRRNGPAPDPTPAPAPPAEAEPSWEEPTQPAYRAIAARGTQQRARLARATRDTQPLPLPRPPAGQKR